MEVLNKNNDRRVISIPRLKPRALITPRSLFIHYITPIWYCIILFSYLIIQKIISIKEKLCFMIHKQKIIFVALFQLFWMFYCTKRWNADRSNNTIIHLAIIHLSIYFVIYAQFVWKCEALSCNMNNDLSWHIIGYYDLGILLITSINLGD